MQKENQKNFKKHCKIFIYLLFFENQLVSSNNELVNKYTSTNTKMLHQKKKKASQVIIQYSAHKSKRSSLDKRPEHPKEKKIKNRMTS